MSGPPRAEVGSGLVEGEWANGVAVFRGIPFAAAPVGPDRFAAPRAPRPWDGVRDATRFGPAPPQPGWRPGDDDCLSVAVWTPDPGARGLPVIVWISGGAYLRCSTANPHHDGTVLAAAGAVVVSVDYRVGVEGWAHLPGHPDNRGLLDQVAGLRWTRENVAAFGGDPDDVTVFGQSSGAGSVAALLVMPRAAGLFDRAVLHSVPGTYFAPDLAAEVTDYVLAELDPALRVEDVPRVAPERLVAAAEQVGDRWLHPTAAQWGPVAYTPTPFSPVVDGDVLPVTPWEGLSAGAATGIPMLLGHVRDEGRLLAARLGPVTHPSVDHMIDTLAPTVHARQYRAQLPDASPAQLREAALGDWLLRMPTLRLAEAAHAGGSPVWLSVLEWGFGWPGAAHTLDTLLVFGTADIQGEVTAAGPPAVEQHDRLAALMRAEHLAFVATGDPGWPRFDPRSLVTRIYSAAPSVGPYPHQPSRAIWRDHRWRALGGSRYAPARGTPADA